MTFVDSAVQLEDAVRAAERMQQGPVVDVLDGVIGAVVRAPAREAAQVIALVEVLRVKDFAGFGVQAKQFALSSAHSGAGMGGDCMCELGASGPRRTPRRQRQRTGSRDESAPAGALLPVSRTKSIIYAHTRAARETCEEQRWIDRRNLCAGAARCRLPRAQVFRQYSLR